ncbi:hypothetical protein WA026_020944 [Henosepilachna vigintioctopunctata]|uniref:Uncharacterized protein n=1 Tax=Henosepilachna vigintioctopunctata TaxID=420089 RepID=A0AAW1UR21_9CUCU
MSRSLFLDFNSIGEAFVSFAYIDRKYCTGITRYYRSCNEFNITSPGYFQGASCCDGKFLEDRTIVLAENTGRLRVIKVDEEYEKYVLDTVDSMRFRTIREIAVWKNSLDVAVCLEERIMIFDVKAHVHSDYFEGHTEYIYSVDTFKEHQHCFVTCGADKKALLWDKRDVSYSLVLYVHEFWALKSIAWNQINDNQIACGTLAGEVYLLDKRKPESFVDVYHCPMTNIHRISMNENSNQLAICGDTEEVVVLDCTHNDLKNVYSNSEHESYVRGMKFRDNVLYTCAFTPQIYKHEL